MKIFEARTYKILFQCKNMKYYHNVFLTATKTSLIATRNKVPKRAKICVKAFQISRTYSTRHLKYPCYIPSVPQEAHTNIPQRERDTGTYLATFSHIRSNTRLNV